MVVEEFLLELSKCLALNFKEVLTSEVHTFLKAVIAILYSKDLGFPYQSSPLKLCYITVARGYT